MKLANGWFGSELLLLIDGQFLLKSNQFGPFPLVFSVWPDTFLARTVSAVTPVLLRFQSLSLLNQLPKSIHGAKLRY